MLDTHAAGMDEPKAEAIVDTLNAAISDPLTARLATKTLDILIGP